MDKEKKYRVVTMYVFLFAFIASLSSSIILENTILPQVDTFYGEQPVEYTELQSYSTDPKKIKAIVKGSIYETGENMTVFGACFDGDGYLLEDSTANFTAWFPNGTIMYPTGPMIPILGNQSDPNSTSGRFRIHVTMADTIGTYLTQFNCTIDQPGPNDDYAIAFGEWQNPQWVKRIGDTQQTVLNISQIVDLNSEQLTNISNQITNFSQDVQTNFSTVIEQINNLNVTVGAGASADERQINELRELVHAISTSFWVIDETNPTYSLSSGTHNYQAVDMVGPNNVHAVSSDGFAVYWDGETWTERNLSGTNLLGVSVVPAALPYAWYAGSNGGLPVYSINGAAVQSVAGIVGGTSLVDIKAFQQPNNPEGTNYVYAMSNTGEVIFSDDSASTWTNVMNMTDSASTGHISQVVDNVVDAQVTEGYRMLFGMGDGVTFYDGVDYSTTFTLTGQEVRDVGLLYEDVGWVITEDGATNESKVYTFDGTALTLQYQTNGTVSMLFEGLGVAAQNDLWIVTADPSVYYHYNGRTWEYARFPFSEFVGVIIGFGNTSTITGLHDITMFNGKNGYAVGDDGLIMKFRNHHDERFDEILDQINATGNITNTLIQELTNITLSMNASFSADFTAILNKLDALNASLTIKLDEIQTNITLMSVVVGDIYTNTLTILTQLGIIQGQLNQTIQIANDTLTIVTDTQTDVEELVNRSRRPRAWITQ
jgi:hypothetical protein